MRKFTPPGRISILDENVNSLDAQTVKDLFNLLNEQPTKHSVLVPVHLLERCVERLKSKDARITELIRYNSEQVVARRVLKAHLDVCLTALQKAAAKFRFYGSNHRQKGTPEADEKAQTNDLMATEMEAAMLWQIDPSEMGRP